MWTGGSLAGPCSEQCGLLFVAGRLDHWCSTQIASVFATACTHHRWFTGAPPRSSLLPQHAVHRRRPSVCFGCCRCHPRCSIVYVCVLRGSRLGAYAPVQCKNSMKMKCTSVVSRFQFPLNVHWTCKKTLSRGSLLSTGEVQFYCVERFS